MARSIEVIECEGTDHLPKIMSRLNDRYQRMKERNPRGYRDQMDMQFDNIMMEIAEEMGGEADIEKDGEIKFYFIQNGCRVRR